MNVEDQNELCKSLNRRAVDLISEAILEEPCYDLAVSFKQIDDTIKEIVSSTLPANDGLDGIVQTINELRMAVRTHYITLVGEENVYEDDFRELTQEEIDELFEDPNYSLIKVLTIVLNEDGNKFYAKYGNVENTSYGKPIYERLFVYSNELLKEMIRKCIEIATRTSLQV